MIGRGMRVLLHPEMVEVVAAFFDDLVVVNPDVAFAG
jgi:hypothetical protein